MAFSEQLGADGTGEGSGVGKGEMEDPTEKDFQSVDVELGEDPVDQYDFKKSVDEAKGKPVLE